MTRTLSTQAQCAAAIRKELKGTFPSTKFSVTSESFSGGDAVRVTWTDGPTSEQVDYLVRKYQYGHFNGMTDYYEYSNRRDDIPQTKYISTRRDYSPDVKIEAVAEINTRFGWSMLVDTFGRFTADDYDKTRQVWQLIQERAY